MINSIKNSALIFFSTLLIAQTSVENLNFHYGFIGKKMFDSDSLFSISNGDTLQLGDHIKLNFEFEKGTWFYVLTESQRGEYNILYTSSITDFDDEKIFSSLEWLTLNPKNIPKSFTLISSNSQLTKLEDQINKYENAKHKSKNRFKKIIKKEIDRLSDHPKEKTKNNIVQRLEKPVIGGVTYRGMLEGVITEKSLTYKSSGKSIVVATFNLTID